jgi:hypothetical protein
MAKRFKLKEENKTKDFSIGQSRMINRLAQVQLSEMDDDKKLVRSITMNMEQASNMIQALLAIKSSAELPKNKEGHITKAQFVATMNKVRSQLIEKGGIDTKDVKKKPVVEESIDCLIDVSVEDVPVKKAPSKKQKAAAKKEAELDNYVEPSQALEDVGTELLKQANLL